MAQQHPFNVSLKALNKPPRVRIETELKSHLRMGNNEKQQQRNAMKIQTFSWNGLNISFIWISCIFPTANGHSSESAATHLHNGEKMIILFFLFF